MSKTVHVILQRDVAKLGKGGEVVKVASGYARNYLLPEGFADVWHAIGAAREQTG